MSRILVTFTLLLLLPLALPASAQSLGPQGSNQLRPATFNYIIIPLFHMSPEVIGYALGVDDVIWDDMSGAGTGGGNGGYGGGNSGGYGSGDSGYGNSGYGSDRGGGSSRGSNRRRGRSR
jgi:hypothetical protein